MKYDEIKRDFNEFVLDENWNEVNKLRLDLEETGNQELEVELISTLTDEQLLSYKKWDERINGDIDTQTDDFS